MNDQKQVNIQMQLKEARELQFALLCDRLPKEPMMINHNVKFDTDTENRTVRCTVNIDYKLNDITQMMLAVQTAFIISPDSWSQLYSLDEDAWTLPAGMLQHFVDVTMGVARGVLAARAHDHQIEEVVLPLISPQFVRNNLRVPRAS